MCSMRKGEQTKADILCTGVALVSEIGLDGLTIGTLAKQVGLSKSGLYAHFESKEDLQIQVLDAAADQFISMVVAPSLKKPRGIARIRAFVENWMKWEDAPGIPGGCVFIAVANELDDKPGPVRDRFVSYQRDWIEALAGGAEVAKQEGQFRADLDVEQFAYDLYAIILGYHYFNRLMHDPGARDRAFDAFDRLIEAAGRD